MRILLTKSGSFLSKAIRWDTWRSWSHVALLFSDDTVIEAVWPKVRKISFADWKKENGDCEFVVRTIVCTAEQEAKMRAFAEAQVGKPYDWRDIVRFVTRKNYDGEEDDRWICSELGHRAVREGGVTPLVRIEDYKVSPGAFDNSPILLEQ